MTKIVNNDKLTFVLTGYGLDRVAEALSDPSVNLYITKIKVGSGNNFEYYEPTTTQTELKGLIEDYEFPILDKALLEDNLTVSFHAVIPETFSGYDIREIGLYETYQGKDNLFAISTQQPFVKPLESDRYLINIDYYIFLKSQNFADAYDQIELDPENQLITKENLEDLMSTILFAQGNLMDQIGHNSDVIGLNRASQLYDKIAEEMKNFGYTSTYNNYSDIMDITTVDKIFSYWVFNYPRRTSSTNSITDISKNGYNLASDSAINLYNRSYFGFMPMLEFSDSKYFYLSPDAELDFLNSSKTADIDFSMIFCIEPITSTTNRTLLAKSDYSTGTHVFEVQETTDNKFVVTLFAGTENYITFSTEAGEVPTGAHVAALSYTSDGHTLNLYINGKKMGLTKTVTGTYEHMNSSPTILYAYSAIPEEVKYADSSTAPTALYNVDGTPNTDEKWGISGTDVMYNNVNTTYTSSKDVTLAKMYTWTYEDLTETHSIYTKDATISETTKLYNADYTEYTGTDFAIVLSGTTYIIQYLGNDTTQGTDVPAKTIYAWVYTEARRVLWANSPTTPTVLYNSNGNIYTDTDWTITSGVVKYKSYTATYTSQYNVSIPSLNVTSYITDANGNKTQYISSYVGIISVIKTEFSDSQLEELSLIFQATLGQNPCIETC